MSSTPSRSEIESALSGRTKKKAAKARKPVEQTFDLNVPPRRQQVIGGDLTGISSRPKKGFFSRYSDIGIAYWIAIGMVLLIMLAFFWPQTNDQTREVTAAEANVDQLNSSIEPIVEVDDAADASQSFTRDSDLDRAGVYREQDQKDEQLRTLIKTAEAYIAKGQYTQPANQNAVEVYQQILEIDPRNVTARQGLEYINGRFLTAGYNALEKGNEAVAESALKRLAAIDDESADYLELESAIASWKINTEVSELLSKADEAFAKDALILPANDNALYFYRRALGVDESNEAATQGVQKVADTFVDRASDAVLQGQYDAAAAHLATVSVIDPSHASIPLIEAMMEQARPLSEQASASVEPTEDTGRSSESATASSDEPEQEEATTVASTIRTTPPARPSEQRTPERQASEQADFDRQYLKQGLEAYYKGEYEKAAALLQPLADKGIARAQFRLAYMYYLGRGFKRDRQEADRRIRAALPAIRKFAEEGRAWAQSDIGSLYEDGLVLPRDFGEAVYWYRSAAEQGYPGAQTNLGIMYARGRGVSASRRTAIEWFQRAAKQGDSVAMRNLKALGVN